MSTPGSDRCDLRSAEPVPDIDPDQPVPVGPGGEGAGGGDLARQRGAGEPAPGLRPEPGPQQRQVQLVRRGAARGRRPVEQGADVAEVGTDRVGAAAALDLQVLAERREGGLESGRQLVGGGRRARRSGGHDSTVLAAIDRVNLPRRRRPPQQVTTAPRRTRPCPGSARRQLGVRSQSIPASARPAGPGWELTGPGAPAASPRGRA